MDPITLAALAYSGWKMLKGGKKTPKATTPATYPSATTRGSTEREDETGTGTGAGAGDSTGGVTPDETPTLTPREQRGKLGWGGTGAMEGFRVGYGYEGDEKARNSVKNTFGRIASRYEAKPSSIDAILNDPDFKKFFPNAKKAGFDKIDFGGVLSDFETGDPVGVIDVGAAFDPTTDTGRGWWWGYGDGGTTVQTPGGGIKTPAPDTKVPKVPGYETPTFAANTTPGITALTPEEIWNVPERPNAFQLADVRTPSLASMSRRYR